MAHHHYCLELATISSQKALLWYVIGDVKYCVGHQNRPFSKQNLQGATAASFCRILDREEALESSNAVL